MSTSGGWIVEGNWDRKNAIANVNLPNHAKNIKGGGEEVLSTGRCMCRKKEAGQE